MDGNIISTDLNFIIPDAVLFHLGILTSSVHMAWMRAVCGRLKSDYRYSKDIVYNNFPWPTPTEAQKARIEETAQAILDARALIQTAHWQTSTTNSLCLSNFARHIRQMIRP